MDRRTLLLSGGGLAGLGLFHQRRRLRRWDDRNALRAARDRDRPTPPPSTTLTVTDDRLEPPNGVLKSVDRRRPDNDGILRRMRFDDESR